MQHDDNSAGARAAISGRSADSAVETRFILRERRARAAHMRVFAGLLAAMLIGYSLINPLFFTRADEIRFTLMLAPALAVLAGYAAATYWRGYASLPLIDFVALLAVALLIMAENALLFDE
ncbi:hypothetical protein, partial [Blastomonas sp.]|uniref:hypothetical protein n=1 Tax=Blastomonas sp. TaxID=1909299 RepID=UPI003593775B